MQWLKMKIDIMMDRLFDFAGNMLFPDLLDLGDDCIGWEPEPARTSSYKNV